MLFRSFTSISLLAASAVCQSNFDTIINSLQTISTDNDKLAASLNSFNGEFVLSIPILGANIQLNTDLSNGASSISGGGNLTDSEAINLVGPVQTLAANTDKTVDLLISKYDAFKQNQLTGIVYVTTAATRNNAQTYSNAIISKVPASLQEVARNIAKPIDDAFARALAKYQS